MIACAFKARPSSRLIRRVVVSIAWSSSTTAHGIFQPLDTKNGEIRILDLLPGGRDAPVHCHIRTVSLANQHILPTYDALSYTWGSRKDQYILIRSGEGQHEMSVTNNLHSALVNMRSVEGDPLSLWVDAVCINQFSSSEKSAQVAQMGHVFKSARRVVVWLGEHKVRGRFAQLMRHLSRIVATIGKLVNEDVRDLMGGIKKGLTMRDLTGGKIQHSAQVFRSSFSRLKGIISELVKPTLCNMEDALVSAESKWHTRAWVCQEYILASKITFQFGEETLDRPGSVRRDEMRNAARYLGHWNVVQLFDRTSEWSSSFGRTQELEHLLYAAIATRGTKASDPRDKVYSLLGLLPNDTAKKLAPSYTLAPWEVYARATHLSIREAQNLIALEFAAVQRPAKSLLPTWAVGFSSIPMTITSLPSTADAQLQVRIASWFQHGTPYMDVADLPTLDDECRNLTLTGTFFSRVYAMRQLNLDELSHCRPEGPPPCNIRARYMSLPFDHFNTSPGTYIVPPEIPEGTWDPIIHASLLLDQCAAHWHSHRVKANDESHMPGMLEVDRPSQRPATGPQSFNSNAYLSWQRNLKGATSLSICVLENGCLGLVPSDCEVGDAIVYALGAKSPLVLQRAGNVWYLRGTAHIDNPGIQNLDDPRSVRDWNNTQSTQSFTIS